MPHPLDAEQRLGQTPVYRSGQYGVYFCGPGSQLYNPKAGFNFEVRGPGVPSTMKNFHQEDEARQLADVLTAKNAQAVSLKLFYSAEAELPKRGWRYFNHSAAALGSRLLLKYEISTTLTSSFSVWLGANIWSHEDYFYNSTEDVDVRLTGGRQTYERYLTLNSDWIVGRYKLQAQVWFGRRSEPENSLVLAKWEGSELEIRPTGQKIDFRPKAYHDEFWRLLSKHPSVKKHFEQSGFDWKTLAPAERNICEAADSQAALNTFILHDKHGRLIDPHWPSKEDDWPDWVDASNGVAEITFDSEGRTEGASKMNPRYSVAIVDWYYGHHSFTCGLSIAAPDSEFPLFVGCSLRTPMGEVKDLPGKWLRSAGLALWDVSVNKERGFGADPSDQFSGVRGEIIFALWRDDRFSERLCDTGWVPWKAPYLIGASTAGLDMQEEQMRRKYMDRFDAWRAGTPMVIKTGGNAIERQPRDLSGPFASSTPPTTTSHELFDETQFLSHLQKISSNPSMVGQFVDSLRAKFTSRREIGILDQWAQQYGAGERLIKAKTEMLRAATEYRGLEHQRQQKEAETDAAIAKHLADKEEHLARAAKAKASQGIELGTIQSRIDAINNPLKDLPKPESTPEQKRAEDKKKCEARIAELKGIKQDALKITDEDERIMKVNALDDAIQREYERWAKLV